MVSPTQALLTMDAPASYVDTVCKEAVSMTVAYLRVRAAPLRGTCISGDEVPRLIDEIPVIAVAAAVAEGETQVRDAAELRVKESDRIETTLALLRAMGAEAEGAPDGLVLSGGARLRGGVVDAAHDHRIAMAGAVAAMAAQGESRIEGADAAGVSYPGFYAALESGAVTR